MERQALVEGVHFVRVRRAGKPIRWYVYAWRGGPQIKVEVQVGRPRLTTDDAKAIVEARAELVAEQRVVNTISSAVRGFKQSNLWKGLSDNTRRVWGGSLNSIEAKWADVPIRALGHRRARPKIVRWHEAMAESSPRGADIAAMVLSKLMGWALDQGFVDENPAAKIPRAYIPNDRAAVIWSDEDIAAINEVAQWPLRDAVALASMTGLRRADLITLRWDEIGEYAIERVALKRSRGKRFTVTMPILPKLHELLDDLRTRPRQEGVETVLVNHHGRSWKGDGLGTSFHNARDRANGGTGISHTKRDPQTGEEITLAKRFHDLRGTFATKLMTLPEPLDDATISGIMGWSETQVSEIRKRYVDDGAMAVALGKRLHSAGL